MSKLTPLLQVLAFIFVVYFGWKTWQQIYQAKEAIKKTEEIHQSQVHGEIPVSAGGYQAQLDSIRDVKTMGVIRAVGRNAWLQGYSAALAKRIDPVFDIKKQRLVDSLELERILKSE